MRIPRQRLWAAVAFAAAGVLVVSGCGSSAGGSSSSGGTKGPIVIGAAIGQTGILKSYDGPAFAVVKYDIDQINAAGGIKGRKVELKVLDTKSEITRGGQVAQQLIDDGAQILIVSSDFDFGSPAALVAQKHGMVSISLGAASPKFGVQGIGDKAFSFAPSTGNCASALSTFALGQGYKKAFTLLDDTLSYTRGFYSAFTKFYKQGGGTVVGTDSFKNDDSSIATQINKIKAAKPDVLFMATYPPGGASALRQIRAAGVDIPIISGDPFDSPGWNDAVPNLSNFFIDASAWTHGDDPNPAVNQYVEALTKATGNRPTGGRDLIGDTIVQALKIAIEKTGTTDGAKLAAALQSFNKQQFLTGTVTLSAQDHIPLDSPLRIIQYTNGKPAYLKTVTPDATPAVTDGIG
jgi:branched-chain amino acid transport system substrate-binding protein